MNDEDKESIKAELSTKLAEALKGGLISKVDISEWISGIYDDGGTGGSYTQSDGPYTQTGGGTHNQSGGKGYTQSKSLDADALIHIKDDLAEVRREIRRLKP